MLFLENCISDRRLLFTAYIKFISYSGANGSSNYKKETPRIVRSFNTCYYTFNSLILKIDVIFNAAS